MGGHPLRAATRRIRVLTAASSVAALLVLLLVAGVQVALALAPAVLLLAVLAWGHYPAEDLIARWAGRGLRRHAAHAHRPHWGSAPAGFTAAPFTASAPLRGPPVLRVV